MKLLLIGAFLPLALCQTTTTTTTVRETTRKATQEQEQELPRGLQESRIINGVDANPTRYPYTVSLQDGSFHFCGGSLIAPDLVLSAAHCSFSGFNTQNVVLNPYRLSNPLDVSETFTVTDQVAHPDWESINAYDHDYRIFKLSGTSSLPVVKLNLSNATLPIPGESLQVMGWGTTSTSSSSNILQEVDVEYISNEECASGSNYATLITDDMLCAAEINKGSCQGDSGGPLVVLGETAADDVQVGIVSWGYGCAEPENPGVYARVHEERHWIRFHVCRLSDDPPDYFDCDNGPVTLSPMPTSTPTAPTASPNPTSESTDVLLRIDLDSSAPETGWSVEEVATGTVVAGVPAGGYESSQYYDTVLEPLSLQQGEEYTLTLLDSYGDGMYGQVYIYLGSEMDDTKIIGFYTSSYTYFTSSHSINFRVSPEAILPNLYPTSRPTIAPSGEPSAPSISPAPTADFVTLLMVLTMDSYAYETGWRIETTDGVVVYEVETGSYSSLGYGEVITDTVQVPGSDSYVLVIVDSFGDGFSASAYLHLGETADPGKVLAYYGGSGGSFSTWSSPPFELDQFIKGIFPTAAPSEPTATPSSMPSAPTASPAPTANTIECLFEIETDVFPYESGWIVTDTGGEQVHEVLAGEYDLEYTAYATTLELQVGAAYQLTLIDIYGDGFQGNFTIYYGDEDDVSKVLLRYEAFLSDSFSSQLTMDFVVSESDTIPVFPTSSPTTAAPTPSPGPYLPCNVCGSSGEVVTNFDGIFDYTADVSLRCGALEQHGAQGLISATYCATLPSILNETCGCM